MRRPGAARPSHAGGFGADVQDFGFELPVHGVRHERAVPGRGQVWRYADDRGWPDHGGDVPGAQSRGAQSNVGAQQTPVHDLHGLLFLIRVSAVRGASHRSVVHPGRGQGVHDGTRGGVRHGARHDTHARCERCAKSNCPYERDGWRRVCASPGVALRSKPRQHCFFPGQHFHTDSHGGGQLRRSSTLCYSV